MHKQNRIALLLASWGILIFSMHHAHAWSDNARADAGKSISIPAGDLRNALETLARQTGIQLLYDAKSIKGLRTDGVKNAATPELAVVELLRGTPLTTSTDASGAILISAADKVTRTTAEIAQPVNLQLARAEEQRGQSARQSDENKGGTGRNDEPSEKGIPEMLVRGKRSLNRDVARSPDDALPYVVFDRKAIETSGATTLEQFLKTRLPQNTVSSTGIMTGATSQGGAISRVNLRGLGSNQTLILVDGRRTPSVYGVLGDVLQGDINGLPMSSVERIEILPATASGIYGGSAIGGVINIVLRRDYAGVETRLGYGNTFDSVSGNRRADVSAGFSLEEGRTSILVSGSYQGQDPLVQGERDFVIDYYRRWVGNLGYAQAFGTQVPYGATTNIRSVNGSNLTLKTGSLPLNSNITFVPYGYAGPASDNGAALVANAGRFNLDSAPGGQEWPVAADKFLVGGSKIVSASATVRRQFGSRLEVFADFSSARNEWRMPHNTTLNTSNILIPATLAGNPFQQDINVTFTSPQVYTQSGGNRTGRLSAGFTLDLAANWTLGADAVWGRNEHGIVHVPTLASLQMPNLRAAVANGTANVLRDTVLNPINPYAYDVLPPALQTIIPPVVRMLDVTARAAGPLWRLPGGPVNLATMVERREEKFGRGVHQVSQTASTIIPEQFQTVESIYVETRIPLLARDTLELQLALRHDRYTTDASIATTNPNATLPRSVNKVDSTDPTVSLKYQPWGFLMVRGSVGTGFLPPAVSQIVATPSVTVPNFFIPDPQRGNTVLTASGNSVTFLTGGNAALKPEESKTRSFGAVLTPGFLPGLRMSVDYVRTAKVDAITRLGFDQMLAYESFLPGRVVRSARLSTDPAGWSGPVTFMDLSPLNLSRATIEAYDVQLDYPMAFPAVGDLELFVLATWQTHYITQLVPQLAPAEGVNKGSGNPLKFKANFGLNWTRASWSAGWVAQYFGSYWVQFPASAFNLQAQGAANVDAQIFHDVYIKYRPAFPESSRAGSLLSNTELSLNVTNLLNTAPAYDTLSGTHRYSYFGDARMGGYSLNLKKSW